MTAPLQPSLPIPCTVARQDAAPPRGGRGFGHKEHKEHKGGWELCALCVLCGQKRMEGASRGGKVFQPLEKKFPIIGKNGRNFPTIGKIFSNRWKNAENFFQSLENGRKICPIVGKLVAGFALCLVFAAAPPARAWDGKGIPEPSEVHMYGRMGHFKRIGRDVTREDGDRILELLRGWKSFGKPQEEARRAPCLDRDPYIFVAYPEYGENCLIFFYRDMCDADKTRLTVRLPPMILLSVPDEVARQLRTLFDAWDAADRRDIQTEEGIQISEEGGAP